MFRFRESITRYRLKRRQATTSAGVIEVGRGSKLGRLVSYLALLFFALLIVFPFYFMLSTSLLNEDDSLALQAGKQILFPKNPDFSNYITAATVSDIDQDYLNALKASALISFVSVFTRLFFTISFGYAFSLPNWRFKRISWTFYLLILAIPEAGVLVGQFLIVQKTPLKDTLVWVALNIPFVTHIFSGYLFRNAFESIPSQVKEAAAIDGISKFSFFFKIALPMVRSTLLTVVIIAVFGAWNAYLWPNLILTNKTSQWKPINLWVYSTGNAPQTNDLGRFLLSVRLAGAILAILPMFLFYFLFRRKIMAAISKDAFVAKG